MNYDILEARIEFKENKIQRITVLVDCTTGSYIDVRAIFATTKPRAGYMFLPIDSKISNDLLQDVAAGGQQTVDRDKIFPNWKKKHKSTAF